METLLWSYYNILSKDHEDTLINTKVLDDILTNVNTNEYDVIHLHYDVYYHILDKITSSAVIYFTSHYPHIYDISKHKDDNYTDIFNFMITQTKYNIMTLTEKDKSFLIEHGADEKLIEVVHNGVNLDSVCICEEADTNKSLCVFNVIDDLLCDIIINHPNIDFVGRLATKRKKLRKYPNYIGHKPFGKLSVLLHSYVNLIILDKNQNDPILLKYALASGVGIVTLQKYIDNLPNSDNKKFISSVTLSDAFSDNDVFNNIVNENFDYCLENRVLI